MKSELRQQLYRAAVRPCETRGHSALSAKWACLSSAGTTRPPISLPRCHEPWHMRHMSHTTHSSGTSQRYFEHKGEGVDILRLSAATRTLTVFTIRTRAQRSSSPIYPPTHANGHIQLETSSIFRYALPHGGAIARVPCRPVAPESYNMRTPPMISPPSPTRPAL